MIKTFSLYPRKYILYISKTQQCACYSSRVIEACSQNCSAYISHQQWDVSRVGCSSIGRKKQANRWKSASLIMAVLLLFQNRILGCISRTVPHILNTKIYNIRADKMGLHNYMHAKSCFLFLSSLSYEAFGDQCSGCSADRGYRNSFKSAMVFSAGVHYAHGL